MTLAMMQIANGISAMLMRGQIAYTYPDCRHHARLRQLGLASRPVRSSSRLVLFCSSRISCSPTRVSAATCTWSAATARRRNIPASTSRLIIASVMVISAMCSGIAGMLGVAYFGSAQQNQFDTFLLDAIAAVVVGGTSLFGGRGGIGNTIIGLLVLGVCEQRA
jgi:ribose transport system permease protein